MQIFIAGITLGGLCGLLLAGLLQANHRTKAPGDRRSLRRPLFPLRDREGNVTLVDRRHQPDRRLGNI